MDKSKFLWRISEWGDWFAALGRKRKEELAQGIDDADLKERHKDLHGLTKWRKAKMRHHRWWPVYVAAYKKAEYEAELDVMTDMQAFKYARKQAEQAVVDAFHSEVTTTRAVRDAFDETKE